MQRIHVDLLFSKYVRLHGRDLSDELRTIADFFSFLSERVIPHKLVFDVDTDLLERFEPVYLLLLDKLNLYPPSLRAQAEEIARQANLCNIIAVASALGLRMRRRLHLYGVSSIIFQSISFFGIKATLNDQTKLRVNADMLFQMQVALKRLAGIVRYASSIELVDYDETFHEFKKNYDPDLVDRSKLLALLNILRMDINSHPASDEKALILAKLEHIEQELKRPKVRWGVVVTSFFILFGFMADLKTLKPDIYTKPLAIVEQILSCLHQDGLVSTKAPQLLGPHDHDSEDQPDNGVNEVKAVLPKRREEFNE